tara:strand:- start:140 stop:391 length:252 start_codon:yes stop_codon:yes gene_type:complete
LTWRYELKIIQGNFNKSTKKTLNDKVLEGLQNLKDQSNDEEIRYPFILIVDTGEELRVVSDVEMEKFNLLLDLVKHTILTGDY